MKLTPPGFHPKKWNILGIFSLLIITILSSCKNDPKEIISGDGNIKISLAGIEDYTTIDKVAATRKSNNNTPVEIQSYEGFDAITSIEVEEPTAAVSTKKASSEVTKLASNTTKLQDTVRYRLLFFKASDNSVVVNELIKAGDAPRIRLDIGVTYKWVAYSINTANVPDITENIINKNDLANKDLLYASNTITIQPGDNFLNLTLKRYTTQYEVNVDTRGMFAAIDEGTKVTLTNNNGNILQKSDFNILTGQYIGTPELFNITSGDFVTIINGQNDKKKVFFHTAIEPEIIEKNKLKLTFTPLNIIMDDNITKRNFPNTIINLEHNPIPGKSSPGTKYIINSMLIESGIQVGTSTTVWARSNLWYDSNNEKGKYRFRISPFERDLVNKLKTTPQGVLSDENDLWKFRSATPDGNTDDDVDPCSLVYPNGLWKMPSRNEFAQLPDKMDSIYIFDKGEPQFYGLLGLIGGNKFYEYVARWNSVTTSSSTYEKPFNSFSRSTSNHLSFSGAGYTMGNNDDISIVDRPAYSTLLNVADILGAAGGLVGGGYYWCTGPNTLTTTADYFRFTYSQTFLLKLDLQLLALNVLNINNANKDERSGLQKSYRMNLRCVRDPNYKN